MAETVVLTAVYPVLAVKTLEELSQSLTLAHRNGGKHPRLTAELRRAAATACGKHGVVGDDHVAAVADLAADTMMRTLPGKHINIEEIPGVERTKDAFAKARRDYIIDLFGEAPMNLLAAFMLQFATDPKLTNPKSPS